MPDEKNQDTHADQHQDTHSEVADQGRDSHTEVELLRRQIQYLRTLVHTDELTGLSNLRHFSETLSLELERTRRSKQPTCLILMDIDKFKEVNDNYGHEVGNLVLCHLASLMRRAIRRLDTPCRFGGDEFAIILPGTGLDQGIALAERLRTLIQRSPFESGRIRLEIGASTGVGDYKAKDGELTEREFVEGVDQLLYRSKRNDRGRICHSHHIEPLPKTKTSVVTSPAPAGDGLE